MSNRSAHIGVERDTEMGGVACAECGWHLAGQLHDRHPYSQQHAEAYPAHQRGDARELLADWLGARPEAYNVRDITDEATTVIQIGVEDLADALLAAFPVPSRGSIFHALWAAKRAGHHPAPISSCRCRPGPSRPCWGCLSDEWAQTARKRARAELRGRPQVFRGKTSRQWIVAWPTGESPATLPDFPTALFIAADTDTVTRGLMLPYLAKNSRVTKGGDGDA